MLTAKSSKNYILVKTFRKYIILVASYLVDKVVVSLWLFSYSYNTNISNFSYLYYNIVMFIFQLHLVRHRVHYYSYDPVTISKGQTTTAGTPCSGAVMTVTLRCGYMVVFVTAGTIYKNPPQTLYTMALYQGYIQVVSAVGWERHFTQWSVDPKSFW